MAGRAATLLIALVCVALAAAVTREAEAAADAASLQATKGKMVSRRSALRARVSVDPVSGPNATVNGTVPLANITLGNHTRGNRTHHRHGNRTRRHNRTRRSTNRTIINAQKPNTARKNRKELKKLRRKRKGGNVNIARKIWTKSVVTSDLLAENITVRANFDCENVFSARKANVETLAADRITVSVIDSLSKTVIIDGDLVLTNQHPKVRAVSFIAESLHLGGVPQWRLVHHDDFEAPKGAEGWSLLETTSCTGVDHFLGGHCKIGAGHATKRFDNLPPHKQVKVTARYHFIDKWAGETAFLKIGEHVAWAHRTQRSAAPFGIDMCGSKDHPETHFAMPVEVVQAHSASFIELSFGSNGSLEQSPCERSFGVDDVMVHVR